MAVPATQIDPLSHWRNDPARFVADVWGVDMEPFQREGLQAVEHHGRVSIRSGHGVGKSTLDAWAVLWFLSTHFPAKAPCTAPTAHQLEDVLIAEIGLWLQRIPDRWREIRESFALKADRLELVGAAKESFAPFRTGSKHNPEALQGFHANNLLFVIDEASGIHQSVFEVAEGALSTPGARVLMTSNPTRTSGYFHESHTIARDQWHTIRVSCADSSRVSPQYIERMARYGTDSNIYRVRVLGDFPTADDDAVMPLELVLAAIDRDIEPVSGPPVWGLDVARFGNDRSAFAKRRNNALLEPVTAWHGKDTMQTAGLVKLAYDEAPEKPEAVFVDVIGMGAGVVDRLNELAVPVVGVNVAESPAVKERFMRYRDELWWEGREWFERRDCIIPAR